MFITTDQLFCSAKQQITEFLRWKPSTESFKLERVAESLFFSIEGKAYIVYNRHFLSLCKSNEKRANINSLLAHLKGEFKY